MLPPTRIDLIISHLVSSHMTVVKLILESLIFEKHCFYQPNSKPVHKSYKTSLRVVASLQDEFWGNLGIVGHNRDLTLLDSS